MNNKVPVHRKEFVPCCHFISHPIHSLYLFSESSTITTLHLLPVSRSQSRSNPGRSCIYHQNHTGETPGASSYLMASAAASSNFHFQSISIKHFILLIPARQNVFVSQIQEDRNMKTRSQGVSGCEIDLLTWELSSWDDFCLVAL